MLAVDYVDTPQALTDSIMSVKSKMELWQVIGQHDPMQEFIGCYGV